MENDGAEQGSEQKTGRHDPELEWRMKMAEARSCEGAVACRWSLSVIL